MAAQQYDRKPDRLEAWRLPTSYDVNSQSAEVIDLVAWGLGNPTPEGVEFPRYLGSYTGGFTLARPGSWLTRTNEIQTVMSDEQFLITIPRYTQV